MRLQLRSLVAAVALLFAASPFAGAVDLLFVTLSDNTIVKYDTTGNVGATIQATQAFFATSNLNNPQGLVFDSSGNLYAANYGGNTISKFNSSGAYVSNINTFLNGPIGLAFDSSGNLYAANNSDSRINKYNSSGTYDSVINLNLNSPQGLAFASGNLYAANYGDSTISKFNSSGGYVSNLGVPDVNSPTGLAFDISGNLYAANYGDNTISKFNSSGGFLSQIMNNLNNPKGLAFDISGNLYAANNGNNTISKYNSSGIFLTSWSTGVAPAFIAFQPVSVPEPSTYALAAIATGVMAAVARRRKARMA